MADVPLFVGHWLQFDVDQISVRVRMDQQTVFHQFDAVIWPHSELRSSQVDEFAKGRIHMNDQTRR